MPFGQVVIGPPGSGKTSYCHGLQQILSQINRKAFFVNLDPANDGLPYECDADIRAIHPLSRIMEKERLGPNGGLVRALELLEKDFDFWYESEWPQSNGNEEEEDYYFVIDCPGQVELFTNHASLRNMLGTLMSKHDFRLVTVHLVDMSLCLDASRLLAAQLLALRSMLMLECPHVNVLSKIDLVPQLGLPHTQLEQYCYAASFGDHADLSRFGQRYGELHRSLSELMEDYGLVRFVPLAVEDKEAMLFLLGEVDRASGLVFGALCDGNDSINEAAVGEKTWDDLLLLMQERYFDPPHDFNTHDQPPHEQEPGKDDK